MIMDREKYAHIIFGKCHAIGIIERPPHSVLLEMLVEDDENWFVSNTNCFDSYWLPGLQEVLRKTIIYLKRNYTNTNGGWYIQ